MNKKKSHLKKMGFNLFDKILIYFYREFFVIPPLRPPLAFSS